MHGVSDKVIIVGWYTDYTARAEGEDDDAHDGDDDGHC